MARGCFLCDWQDWQARAGKINACNLARQRSFSLLSGNETDSDDLNEMKGVVDSLWVA